ncbi:MAG TPA: hypothetical protein VE221_08685, partial [Sphingomicrobium sp.]|nr:hypothetical protein [Sphingomicrobium sp.]
AYDKMHAVGEVAYSERLGRETGHWMRQHPAQVARILLMHLGQVVTPPPWLFRVWGTGNIAVLQSLLASLVGILGCLGLFAGLVMRRKDWCYPALLILGPIAAFILFQPLPRYLYTFYAPLAFSATGLAEAVQRFLAARKTQFPASD